jgi:hypothetical protein
MKNSLLFVVMIALVGCGGPKPSTVLPPEDNRLQQIAKASGGKFDKLSPEDQAWLLQKNNNDRGLAESELNQAIDHNVKQ